MLIDLLAVLETGKRRRAGIPRDTRRPVRIVAGADVTFRIELVEADGTPVALTMAGNDTLTLTGRLGVDGAKVFGLAAQPDATRRGRYLATLLGGTTRNVGARVGVFDAWCGRAALGTFEPVIPLSQLTVEPRAYDGKTSTPQVAQTLTPSDRFFLATLGPGLGPFTVTIPGPAGGAYPDTNYAVFSYVFTDTTKHDSPLLFPDAGKTSSTFVVQPDGPLDAATPVRLHLRSTS